MPDTLSLIRTDLTFYLHVSKMSLFPNRSHAIHLQNCALAMDWHGLRHCVHDALS